MSDDCAETREQDGGDTPPKPSRGAVLGVSEIFAPLPPVAWVCELLGVAPGAPLLMAGYGYSGKTVAAQDFALAVATGTHAWGRFPVRSGRVVHLDYEQGSYLSCLRYQRLARARGIDPRAMVGRLTLHPFPAWYLDGDCNDEVARLSEGAGLVIIDSFKASCPRTDENSSEARIPLDRLTRISEATGAEFMVIHHARKPTKDSPGGARMAIRGSGALFDACGSVVVFSAAKGDPVKVEHEKNRITGRLHSDFHLRIEDIEIDGDPEAGLRVTYGDPGAVSAGNPPSTGSYAELKRRVIALIRDEGPIAGGVNVVRARLKARKEDVSAALIELKGAGVIRQSGTSTEPILTYVGNQCDAE